MAQNGLSWTEKNSVRIFAIGFLVSFLFVWGVVQTPLIYQHQQPVFFLGADYFAGTMQHPGGLVDYLSSLLSQFYTLPVLGALFITVLIFAVGLAAFKVFQIFKLDYLAPLLALLLAGFLLSAHSNYFYTLAPSLAILFTLAVFLLYTALTRRAHFILRLILFSFLARTLYVFVAAPFLLFVLLGLLAELFLRSENRIKKIIATLVFSSSLLWPMLVFNYMFLFDRTDIYTYLLPIDSESAFHIYAKIVWGILCFAPIVGIVVDRIKKQALSIRLQPIKEIILLVVLFVAMAIVVKTSFNEKHKIVIKIDFYAQHNQWQDVLTTAQKHQNVLHRLSTLQYNRALYHSGRLLDDLFGYPQIEGEYGLIRNSGHAFDFPYAIAMLMFEMGNINSAQVWANEALSIEGQSARLMQLLALIHLYKNEYPAAEIYLNKTAKTIGHKKWAQHYTELLQEPHRIPNDPAFAHLDAKTINENFLIRFGQTYAELQFLNEKSTLSKMALEYLLAYNLLSRRLDLFAKTAPHILDLPGHTLPRHLEEALVLIGMSGVEYSVDLNVFDFQPSLVNDLNAFMAVIAKHNNNPQYAQAELLQKFGDTYWYYHLYHQRQELQ